MAKPRGHRVPQVRSFLDEKLVFARVAERDVDFLLVEEFRCSMSFQQWFLRHSFRDRDAKELRMFSLTKVLHSLSSSGAGPGETDLVLVYDSAEPPRRMAVLIENKIDADFQDRQGERYQERKQMLLAAQECDEAVCVLTAPAEYVEQRGGRELFDTCIAYEDMMAHWKGRILTEPTELAERLTFRCEVLDYAIEQYRRVWPPVPDAQITSLWVLHYERAREVAPDLRMKRPDDRPAQSTWVYFNEGLPKDRLLPTCDLYHRMKEARVLFVIHTWAEYIDLVEPILHPKLDRDMCLTQVGNALAVSLDVPPIDLAKSADEQTETIDVALRAAARLRKWYIENRTVLHECARVIREKSGGTG